MRRNLDEELSSGFRHVMTFRMNSSPQNRREAHKGKRLAHRQAVSNPKRHREADFSICLGLGLP